MLANPFYKVPELRRALTELKNLTKSQKVIRTKKLAAYLQEIEHYIIYLEGDSKKKMHKWQKRVSDLNYRTQKAESKAEKFRLKAESLRNIAQADPNEAMELTRRIENQAYILKSSRKAQRALLKELHRRKKEGEEIPDWVLVAVEELITGKANASVESETPALPQIKTDLIPAKKPAKRPVKETEPKVQVQEVVENVKVAYSDNKDAVFGVSLADILKAATQPGTIAKAEDVVNTLVRGKRR